MRLEVFLKYPLALLVGFLVVYLLTPLLRRVAPALGMLDQPDARRVHRQPIPRSGGIAVFFGFHATCAVIFLPPWIPFDGQLTPIWWWHFFILSALILMLGIADDIRSLRPVVKLAGQTLVALLAYYFDMRVGRVLGLNLPPAVEIAATVLWFLAIINAFNLIDGMDGLATGLAAVAAMGLAGAFLFRHAPRDALVLFGLIGACLGFLRYNFNPASIFLGDAGSMFLGLTLAAIALTTDSKSPAFTALVVPLLAMGIPLLDTALAVWRRAARRVANQAAGDGNAASGHFFQPDMEHVHHRLLRSGLSQRATATALYAAAIGLVAVGMLSMTFRSHAVGIYILAFVTGTYVMVRHLAKVELWDSGRAIASGLRRPQSQVVAVLLYPLLDITILALALAIAIASSGNRDYALNLRTYWFDQIPLWCGVPFVGLVLARVYQRVWSRARLSEYVVLCLTLAGGILAASGLAIVTGQFADQLQMLDLDVELVPGMTLLMLQPIQRGLEQQILIYTGIATLALAGLRALPRAVQDAMAGVRSREHLAGSRARPVILYGAGEGGMLFMLQQSYRGTDSPDALHVVALLDEDRNLHGRYVHGHQVAGGAAAAEALLNRRTVDEIILADPISPESLAQLRDLATRKNLRLTQWQTQRTPIA